MLKGSEERRLRDAKQRRPGPNRKETKACIRAVEKPAARGAGEISTGKSQADSAGPREPKAEPAESLEATVNAAAL